MKKNGSYITIIYQYPKNMLELFAKLLFKKAATI